MKDNNKQHSQQRRDMLKHAAALSTLTLLPAFAGTDKTINTITHTRDNKTRTETKAPSVRHNIAILIYPQMVMLDMIGPQMVFNEAGCNIDLVWKDRAAVSTDLAIPLTATATFNEYTHAPDVLLIPGGLMGSIACMNDPLVLDFVQKTGKKARWVTSVCTGSLVLAGAGLLNGYKATSHWGVRHLLPLMGAINTEERVVIDRNRITGGGVTAGIDFGLTLLEKLQGREIAESVELVIEYTPKPPFNVGSPELAGPDRMKAAMLQRHDIDKMALNAAEAARERLKI